MDPIQAIIEAINESVPDFVDRFVIYVALAGKLGDENELLAAAASDNAELAAAIVEAQRIRAAGSVVVALGAESLVVEQPE